MRRLSAGEFWTRLEGSGRRARWRGQAWEADVEAQVRRIIARVAAEGDAALVALGEELDGVRLEPARLRVSRAAMEAARQAAGEAFAAALGEVVERVTAFHRPQLPAGYLVEVPGGVAGQLVRPVRRVGIYAPGGRAAYPSSLVMAAVPARLAGVEEIVVCTPPGPDGSGAAPVLAACAILGIDRVYLAGGAQAVAAMALGTGSVPACDKVVGPGNRWVTTAKRLLYGQVGLDMLAGPSEVAVVADAAARPGWVAADLLAQAEHGPDARVLVVAAGDGVLEAILTEVEAALELPDASGARVALGEGLAVAAPDVGEAVAMADAWGPEHLALHLEDPWAWLDRVTSAGAVFLGGWSPVALGDYGAGPNHVLPTGGTARFGSPLGVYDFVRRTNLLALGPWGPARLGAAARRLARAEGLPLHAASVAVREAGHR